LLSCAIVKAARNVNGPAWIAPGLAAVMLLIGAGCAARLAIWRLRGRGTEPDADALHVFMGVAMAGMLEPRLSPVPGPAWRAVFAAAAAWFAWQAIRARRRRPGGWRCAHPAPHAVECAAMIYMLLPAHPAGPGPATAMPGMSEPAAAANPALALILALFMLGYILWTTDQLATLWRARATTRADPARKGPGAATSPASGPVGVLTVGPAPAARPDTPATAALAPRFAACYKIAMSAAMGYMLVMML
jgi:Domain of unknown function (DUF5134)